MSSGKRMPDGTICWTGPKCRKHGAFFTKNPIKQHLNRRQLTAESTRELTSAEKWDKERLEEALPLYLDLYKKLLLTQTLTYENQNFAPSDQPRQGINSKNHPRMNQLNAEAIQVRLESTKEDRDAINAYQTSYEFVNAYLREGGREGINNLNYLKRSCPHPTKPDTVADEVVDDYEQMAKERIKVLDDVLERHQRHNTNTQILYRAFFLTEDAGTHHMDPKDYANQNYPVGKIIEEKGYMSTTNDSDYMLTYNPHLYEKQIVFEIKTNKGAVLHNPADTRVSIGANERETLLPRGMKYKVVNVTEATYQSTYSEKDLTDFTRKSKSVKPEQTFTVIQLEEVEN